MSERFCIVTEGLRKGYSGRTVLDTGPLALESGRSYALIGPNGSGKTTLLRILAGTAQADSGGIAAQGIDKARLRIGYMPQKSYVFGFSVFRNVALGVGKHDIPADQVEQRVTEALQAVGMEAFAHEKGGGLSGGEAQRVALARMLVRDLDILLLDEPTASMDIAGTLLAEEALARYRAEHDCILVTATHAPSQARRIADRTIMLASGRAVENGLTAQVIESPKSEVGREFLAYWSV